MKSRILKFDDFKKGGSAQEPKAQISVAGGMPKASKPKFVDDVKRAKFSQIDMTLPQYDKDKNAKPIDEADSGVAAAHTELANAIEAEKSVEKQHDAVKQRRLEAEKKVALSKATEASAPAAKPEPAAPAAKPEPAAPAAAPTK